MRESLLSAILRKRTIGGYRSISRSRFEAQSQLLHGIRTLFFWRLDRLMLMREFSPASSKVWMLDRSLEYGENDYHLTRSVENTLIIQQDGSMPFHFLLAEMPWHSQLMTAVLLLSTQMARINLQELWSVSALSYFHS